MGWVSAFRRAHDTSLECVPPRRSVREARPALGATRRSAASSPGTSKSAPRGPDGAARTSPPPNRARPLKGPRFAERRLRVRSLSRLTVDCTPSAARNTLSAWRGPTFPQEPSRFSSPTLRGPHGSCTSSGRHTRTCWPSTGVCFGTRLRAVAASRWTRRGTRSHLTTLDRTPQDGSRLAFFIS
jgi:hypothetical protein